MRFVINGLVALMLLGLLAGMMMHRNATQLHERQIAEVRDEVRQFQREVMLQATLGAVDLSESGYPVTVDPLWFELHRPEHPLIGSSHPWVEIAHEEHRHLKHPIDKIAMHQGQSRFWYNPHTGVVRARVPATTSDSVALDMYNFINDANLSTLFEESR